MRKAKIERTTKETDISLMLDLDGTGKCEIDTGCGFLDHMLVLFARHARYDLSVKCVGDTHVDYHHTTEDIGIALGEAFDRAIGDKAGIFRYGDIILPMDEALILCATDISGRSDLNFSCEMPTPKVGDFDSELCEEFMLGFVRNAKITLHIRRLCGKNTHHIIEGIFKALGRTLAKATAIDVRLGGEIPSTKGKI